MKLSILTSVWMTSRGSSKLIENGKLEHDGALRGAINPFSVIEYERRDQRRLCDSLELVADQLPEQVDRYLCETLNEQLYFNLPIYHRNEEALFERIGRRAPSGMEVYPVLNRIRQEHAMHDCYADELRETLNVGCIGNGFQNPDMLGYMLRFFFETMRRHLAWEDLTLMPMVPQYLTSADLENLSTILTDNHSRLRVNLV